MKWPKSMEKLENGGRLGHLRQNLPPPQKKNGPLDPPEALTSFGGAGAVPRPLDAGVGVGLNLKTNRDASCPDVVVVVVVVYRRFVAQDRLRSFGFTTSCKII